MTGTSSMHPDLCELQAIIVAAAQEELLPRFADVHFQQKPDGSIVTAADIAMQERVQRELASRWPEYELLGEELTEAEQQRLLSEPGKALWCLDPLDGTSNFAIGIPYFSTSIALLVGGEAVFGLVYDPHRNECFMAEKGKGAWLNGKRLGGHQSNADRNRQLIGLVDFKRLPPALSTQLLCDPPYSSQRSFGSSALDWCWIAAGRCHLYLHGKQMLWDYAAGHLILEEVGGRSMSLDGDAVYCAGLQPRSVVAACNEQLFREWVAWLYLHTDEVQVLP